MKKIKILFGVLLLSGIVVQHLPAQNSHGNISSITNDSHVYVIPAGLVKKTLDATLGNDYSTDRIGRQEQRYGIRVGTFAVRQNAFRLKDQLELKGYTVTIRQFLSSTKGKLYVVSAGDYVTATEAHQRLHAIKEAFKLNDMSLASRQTMK